MSTYYVATTGNDTHAGALATPFATILHALSVSADGDTIVMRGGTHEWVGNASYDFAYYTQAVTVSAYASETVIFNPCPPMLIVDGWTLNDLEFGADCILGGSENTSNRCTYFPRILLFPRRFHGDLWRSCKDNAWNDCEASGWREEVISVDFTSRCDLAHVATIAGAGVTLAVDQTGSTDYDGPPEGGWVANFASLVGSHVGFLTGVHAGDYYEVLSDVTVGGTRTFTLDTSQFSLAGVTAGDKCLIGPFAVDNTTTDCIAHVSKDLGTYAREYEDGGTWYKDATTEAAGDATTFNANVGFSVFSNAVGTTHIRPRVIGDGLNADHGFGGATIGVWAQSVCTVENGGPDSLPTLMSRNTVIDADVSDVDWPEIIGPQTFGGIDWPYPARPGDYGSIPLYSYRDTATGLVAARCGNGAVFYDCLDLTTDEPDTTFAYPRRWGWSVFDSGPFELSDLPLAGEMSGTTYAPVSFGIGLDLFDVFAVAARSDGTSAFVSSAAAKAGARAAFEAVSTVGASGAVRAGAQAAFEAVSSFAPDASAKVSAGARSDGTSAFAASVSVQAGAGAAFAATSQFSASAAARVGSGAWFEALAEFLADASVVIAIPGTHICILMQSTIGYPCEIRATGSVSGTGTAKRWTWVDAQAEATQEVYREHMAGAVSVTTPPAGEAEWSMGDE